MSSKLQLDVCYLKLGWRHLVNAYEGKADMVYLQVKLSDPCLSSLRLYMRSKCRYINTPPYLSLYLTYLHIGSAECYHEQWIKTLKLYTIQACTLSLSLFMC